MSTPTKQPRPAPTAAELAQMETLFEETKQAHREIHRQWEEACAERDKWHSYEQSLVHQRNALQTAINGLHSAIVECKRRMREDA